MSLPTPPSSLTMNEKEAYNEFMELFFDIFHSYPKLKPLLAKSEKVFNGFEVSYSFSAGFIGFFINFSKRKYLSLGYSLDPNVFELTQRLGFYNWSLETENVIIGK